MIALSNPEKIALLTDSTADLTPAMREGKPIYVVPLKIRCDDGEFSDGVDIFAQDVYDRLHRGSCPAPPCPRGARSATPWTASGPTGMRRSLP